MRWGSYPVFSVGALVGCAVFGVSAARGPGTHAAALAPAAASSISGGSVAETPGGVTHTWSDPSNAGGNEGSSIPPGQTTPIVCRLTGFQVADGNTWWYRIAPSPWNGAFYASADAFYNNGQTAGSLLGTPWFDPAVPTC